MDFIEKSSELCFSLSLVCLTRSAPLALLALLLNLAQTALKPQQLLLSGVSEKQFMEEEQELRARIPPQSVPRAPYKGPRPLLSLRKNHLVDSSLQDEQPQR